MTVVAPINSVTALTSVATRPWVGWELLIASNRVLAGAAPNSAFSCASICEYAAVAPTTQPAAVSTITKSGARENAQKNASDAPVVVALSSIQLRAAQRARPYAFFRAAMTTWGASSLPCGASFQYPCLDRL